MTSFDRETDRAIELFEMRSSWHLFDLWYRLRFYMPEIIPFSSQKLS